ncbi:MAG: hypothetical protein AYK18_18415 [Theionarchaea archaeon DG-70]|nr:MAG: hypothetical protein AYK18_18415 [Theionarchaea archaeon DG-70]
MLRKKGVILLSVIVIILVVLNVFFSDRWIEKRLESFGSRVVGAKVELSGLKFSLLRMQIQWKRVQVTDPNNTWYNLFETGSCNFHLAPEPLLSKKFIIEGFQLQDIEFNTPREEDGRLSRKATARKPPKIVQKLRDNLKAELDQMPVFDSGAFTFSIDPDELWERIDLQSPGKIQSLKENYEQTFTVWEERFNDLRGREDLDALRTQIQSMNVDRIDTVQELQQNMVTIHDIYDRVNKYAESVRHTRSNFENDLGEIQHSPSVVSAWIEEDYRRAFQLIQPPEMTTRNIAKLLFGERVINKIDRVAGFIGKVRTYSEKARAVLPDKEKPQRLHGLDIPFPEYNALPNFWIKDIDLSGVTSAGTYIKGSITNIVSRQAIIGKPTTIEILGEGTGGAGLFLNGIVDHRGEVPKELLKIEISKVPLKDMRLSSFPLIPYRFTSGEGFILAELDFLGSDFESTVDFKGRNVGLDYAQRSSDISPYLYKISTEIAQSIQKIDLRASVRQTPEDFDFFIKSNVDDVIAEKVSMIITDEVTKTRQYLDQKINAETEEYVQELDHLVAVRGTALTTEMMELYQNVVTLEKEVLQKRKEIEDKTKTIFKKGQEKVVDEMLKHLQNFFTE